VKDSETSDVRRFVFVLRGARSSFLLSSLEAATSAREDVPAFFRRVAARFSGRLAFFFAPSVHSCGPTNLSSLGEKTSYMTHRGSPPAQKT
jgi:hypothetical protein